MIVSFANDDWEKKGQPCGCPRGVSPTRSWGGVVPEERVPLLCASLDQAAVSFSCEADVVDAEQQVFSTTVRGFLQAAPMSDLKSSAIWKTRKSGWLSLFFSRARS